MRTGVLFGESEESEEDKKLNRITVSFDEDTYRLIEELAREKGYSNSLVVNMLCTSSINNVKKQSEIIIKSPLAVAFDLVTK